MLRNAFFYVLSVVAGLGTGFFLMRYLKHEHFVPDNVCAVVFVVTVVVFAAVGHMLTTSRDVPIDEDEESVAGPGAAVEIPYPADGIWGWIMPQDSKVRSGFPMKKSRILIGRDVGCDVMVNDESMSRRHAEIIKTENGYRLSDMNSKNGVFVNNQRISEHYLQNGDVIMLGNVNFLIKIVYPIAPPEPEVQQSDFATAMLNTGDLPDSGIDEGGTGRI